MIRVYQMLTMNDQLDPAIMNMIMGMYSRPVLVFLHFALGKYRLSVCARAEW